MSLSNPSGKSDWRFLGSKGLEDIWNKLVEILTALTTGGSNIAFLKDTISTPVSKDTVTPANNEPLPVALYNDLGRQGSPVNPLDIAVFDAKTGARQIVDQNGAAKVGEAIILVGDKFGTVTPSPLQWDTEFVGSGASLTRLGDQRIETGTTANSEARFQSTKRGRFMISQFNIYHGGIQVDNIPDVNCERRWGMFNPIDATQDGCYWALIGGVWNVGFRRDGVETLVPQGDWTGPNVDLFNANPNLSVYEIQYNAGTVLFFQGPNFIHRITELTDTYAGIYDFKAGLEVKNINGNTTNNGINFRAHGCYRLGEERGEVVPYTFGTGSHLLKAGAGFVAQASLSRTGSGGGAAAALIYDSVDATGRLIGRIDVGADDVKPITMGGSFSDGLFAVVSGTGTITLNISFE